MSMINRILCLLLLFLTSLISVAGNVRQVNTIAELNKAVRDAKPGDIITLKNGTYKNEKLVLHGNGNESNPIIIQAETPGQVFIEGNSNMRIGGQYLEIHGLVFQNGYHNDVWELRSKSGVYANHCRITNCKIDGYNNPDDKAKVRWVLLYGKNNRIDHCTFLNKINEGVLMAVVLEEKGNEQSRIDCSENKHSIDHNYFGRRPVLKYTDNGGEIIRIGDSHTSLLSSQTIVEQNYFEHCDGEVEIISVKSCDNILKNNYFFESAGALVLRHGNRNTVENNIFVGNRKKNSAGIRVINAGHTIKGNYLEGLKGKGSYSAFSVMNALENPKSNEYHQVKDVLIENNILVDCENISFNLRHGNPARAEIQTKIPENVTFRSNVFYNQKGHIQFNFLDGEKGVKHVTFESNLLNSDAGLKTKEGFKVEKNMVKPSRPTADFEYGTSYQ